jgi:cytidine deaminase
MTQPLSDADLLARADAVAARAYAPYSRFHVGCAVLARDGRVIEGVNVENASYPLGVCAERTALARAVAEGYRPGDLVAAAITASPCGGCRQWLHELGLERVVFRTGDRVVTMTPDELLPESFDSSSLS